MFKVFIDGSVGTTGLRIVERLSQRKDISLVTLPEAVRKSVDARAEAINSADVVFLCLPDDAAREAVGLVKNDAVRIIDTSTAHRTSEGWTYGFPELGLRDKIVSSKRIANPGCHASGFIALVKPLVDAGIIEREARLSCFSLTGYTGGGKKMIAEYESEDRSPLLDAPRSYALAQSHKHLPEMQIITGLQNAPAFIPVVAPYAQGMEVTVPLFKADVNGSLEDVKQALRQAYEGRIVRYTEETEGGFLSASALSGRDSMEVSVHGNGERMLLVARFDNLGKGASGAAIQNMNVLLGVDEATGLEL